MWRKRAALGVVVLVVLAGFACVVLSSIGDMFACPVTQHAAMPSPDRSKQAVMFDVDCGATTDFNTQVAIAPMNVEFDRKATPPVLMIDGRWSLPVRWIDDRTLHIRIPKVARTYSKLTTAGDVTVEYAEDGLSP